MTPQQIELVQSSFSKVAPISDQAAAMFYARLFEIAPEVKPLFTGPMEEQGRKLMQMLATAVNGLRNLDAILPAVQDLARRHVGYGAQAEHYPAVGAALLWTLEEAMGDAFTDELKGAWATAYDTLSGAMIAAAYPETA
jgi:nitric oxide dioxygenase